MCSIHKFQPTAPPSSNRDSTASASPTSSSLSNVNMDPFDEWSILLQGNEFIDSNNIDTPSSPTYYSTDAGVRNFSDSVVFAQKRPKINDGDDSLNNIGTELNMGNNMRRQFDFHPSPMMPNTYSSNNSTLNPIHTLQTMQPSFHTFQNSPSDQDLPDMQFTLVNPETDQKNLFSLNQNIDGMKDGYNLIYSTYSAPKVKMEYLHSDHHSTDRFSDYSLENVKHSVEQISRESQGYLIGNSDLEQFTCNGGKGDCCDLHYDQNSNDQVSDYSSNDCILAPKPCICSKLSKKKDGHKLCSSSELTNYPECEYWTVLDQDSSFVKLEEHPSLDKIQITIKTRTDPDDTRLLCKMYSSLRYTMIVKLHSSIFTRDVSNLQGELKTDCRIVYSESIDRLARNSRTGEHLVQMEHHAPVLQRRGEWFETKEKLSFSDVSYHHKNSAFCLKLSITHTTQKKQKSIFTILSSPFMLFARRPKTEVHARKRKYTSPGEHDDKHPKKRRETISLDETLGTSQHTNMRTTESLERFIDDDAFDLKPENNTTESETLSLAFKLINRLQGLRSELPKDKWKLIEKKITHTFLNSN